MAHLVTTLGPKSADEVGMILPHERTCNKTRLGSKRVGWNEAGWVGGEWCGGRVVWCGVGFKRERNKHNSTAALPGLLEHR